MIIILLLQMLFAMPVTNAYAAQVKSAVVVSVTYSVAQPLSVCVLKHALDDDNMVAPVASHCWAPNNPIGDLDEWKATDLMVWNFEVIIKYPTEPTVVIYLIKRVNT